MSLKIIDYVCIGLMVLLVIRGTLRGFITEFMTLASLVLGGLGALFLYRSGAVFLRDQGLQTFVDGIPAFLRNLLPALVQNIPEILSFILIFVVIFVLVKLVEYLLNDIIRRVSLGGVDRFLGFLFGLAEGVALISLLLVALKLQPVFDAESLLEGSFFAGLLFPLITRPESLNPSPAAPVAAVVSAAPLALDALTAPAAALAGPAAPVDGAGALAVHLALGLAGVVCSTIS